MTKEEALKLVGALAEASVRCYQVATGAARWTRTADAEEKAARAILRAILGNDEEAAISGKELNSVLGD